MGYLLHIDTSAEACAIMLAADGIPRVHKLNTDTRNQAANINNMIAEVLAEEQIEMSVLKGISNMRRTRFLHRSAHRDGHSKGYLLCQ